MRNRVAALQSLLLTKCFQMFDVGIVRHSMVAVINHIVKLRWLLMYVPNQMACALIENNLLVASNDPIYNRFSVNGSQQSRLREAEKRRN